MQNYNPLSNKIFGPKLQIKVDKMFTRMEELYPEKIIVYLKRDYPDLSKKARTLRDECGYSDNEAFFKDFGYLYVDVNKISLYDEDIQTKIMGVMNRINDKIKEKIESKNDELSEYKKCLKPIEEFKLNDNWHTSEQKYRNIIKDNQNVINYVFDRLLEFYPDRIIFNLYALHRKFVEKRLNKVKDLFKLDTAKELVELFGFIYIGKTFHSPTSNSNQQNSLKKEFEFVDISLIVKDNNWIPLSKVNVSPELQMKINYVFDLTYALYPNRRLNSLKLLFTFKKFNSYFNTIRSNLNYDTGEQLYADFGFEYNLTLNVNDAILPDAVYSLDKKILYRVFTNKSKFALDEKVELIKENAFQNLNIKTLDLSRLNKRSLIIENNAIVDCPNFIKIINPSSIRKMMSDSIVNSPITSSSEMFEEFNSYYDKTRKIYEYELTNQNNEKNFILSNKFYNVGTYLKKHDKDDLYLITKVRYGNLSNYIDGAKSFDYFEYESNDLERKLSVDYDYFLTGINDGFLTENENLTFKVFNNYLNNEPHIYTKYEDSMDSDIKFVQIPKFKNEVFIGYDKIDAGIIFNNKNKALIDCLYSHKTDNIIVGIIGLNNNDLFLKYRNLIYNDVYIKTFLKIHQLDPAVFFNSSVLAQDRKFILTILKLFPYLDKSLISEEILNEINSEVSL